MHMIHRLMRDTSAATAVEYGLLAAIMAVALISGFGAFSGNLANMFDMVSNTVSASPP